MQISKITSYLKAQDKVKLALYLFSFTFFVIINNTIYNAVSYPMYGRTFFNDAFGFASMCFPEERLNLLPFCAILKTLLFMSIWFIDDKGFRKYLKEIIIIYFLFDIGQVGAFFTDFILELLLNGAFHFSFYAFCSDFELLSWDLGNSHSATFFIALFWSVLLLFYFHKQNKLDLKFFLKRFLIMPFTIFTYALLRHWYIVLIYK